ncbi:protein-glutamine gamma-glutamyltransferase 5-like isoform X1 [Osmerus mordax]|uniref:protein-glutamine gamma-glutamyltransferase 5-like isoform X1 n=1 Tax=Osmerus mordax TaxID=8014 RepID=UPI00350F5733
MNHTYQQFVQQPRETDHLTLNHVNMEAHENHVSHKTLGLSSRHLVVRRGWSFKITLLFNDPVFNVQTLVLEALLGTGIGGLSVEIPVTFSNRRTVTQWSAQIHPGDVHSRSLTLHLCSPPLSPVGLYKLQVNILRTHSRRTYAIGSFVLLCNPWLQEDPVYMPSEEQREEYVKKDHGVLYMGTPSNVISRPWIFGQYEQGVLEACLNILQVSPQHINNRQEDYLARGDPTYLSRVVCAMVNCEDDLGVLKGKWSGSMKDGTSPLEWTGSADILKTWAQSSFSSVCYGQCWVFASVMCTVMRVLGIPSRVVSIFNSAHDTNSNLVIEEYYTHTGTKLNLSKDSIWNFHVWVECWMRRSDLTPEFDGWQVLDPTPQEKSGDVFCCGPCPVRAIRNRCFNLPYDAPFIYASVNAAVFTVILRDRVVVRKSLDKGRVGQRIYTKSLGSNEPQDLTCAYKCTQNTNNHTTCGQQGADESLAVSLKIDKVPLMGENICLTVIVTNRANVCRVLKEHVNAQAEEYHGRPMETFWEATERLQVGPRRAVMVRHQIPSSDYEPVLLGHGFLNLAVVLKDEQTQERVIATEEFNMTSPQISIEVLGGDVLQLMKQHTALVSFTNTSSRPLRGAVLTVEASGLLEEKQQTRMVLLQPCQSMEMRVTLRSSTPGTKMLHASLAHSNSPAITRSLHVLSVSPT